MTTPPSTSTNAPAPSGGGRTPMFYHGMAFLTICIWSFSFLFIIWINTDLDPMGVAVGRKLVFAPMALALLLWRRPPLRSLTRADWAILVLLGIVGGPLYHVTFAWAAGQNSAGESRIDTALLGLILATVPIHTAWIAAIFLKEQLTRVRLLSLALGMIGVTIVILGKAAASRGDGEALMTLDRMEGPIGAVVSAMVGGGIVVVTRRARTVLGPFDVVAVSGLFIVLFSACFTPLADLGQVTDMSQIGWISLLFLGVFGSGVAFLTWATALSGLQAGTVATYLFAASVLAALWGWVFRGEAISIWFLPGAALVFSALLLLAMHSVNARRKPVPEPVPVQSD